MSCSRTTTHLTPMRLEPAAPRSRVKHSTTEPLRSHLEICQCDTDASISRSFNERKVSLITIFLTKCMDKGDTICPLIENDRGIKIFRNINENFENISLTVQTIYIPSMYESFNLPTRVHIKNDLAKSLLKKCHYFPMYIKSNYSKHNVLFIQTQ